MKPICLLVGESGSGKTTIANELESQYGLRQLQSYTTRPRRSPDESGHIFVTKEEFDSLPDKVAYTSYNDYEYCATKGQVDQADIYVIDPAGINYLKQRYLELNGARVLVVVYIDVPDSVRKIRMYSRGDDKLEVARRLLIDQQVFADAKAIADHVVKNEDLQECIRLIEKIYTAD